MHGVGDQYESTTPTVVATVTVGAQPTALALNREGSLYVVNSDDTMTVIDTSTNTVARTVTLDAAPENGTHFLAIDLNGKVYATDTADGVVRSVSVVFQHRPQSRRP